MGKASTLGLPPSFRSISKPTRRSSLLVNIRGKESVGKTYTSLLTIPGPVIYLNGDRDNDLMIEDLRAKGRTILDTKRYVMKFQNDVVRGADKRKLDENANIARDISDRFKSDLLSAIESKVRYIVIDQSMFVWEMIRIARFGKLTEIAQILYSQVNWEMKQIIHQADDTGKVIVWISRGEEIWKDVIEQTPQGPRKVRRPTGRLQTSGFKEFDFEMAVVAEMHYDIENDKRTMRIMKGVRNIGKVLVNKKGKDRISIPRLLALATGKPEEMWGE